MRVFAFRLVPGDDLKVCIEKLVKEEKILAGAILTCVGSLCQATLRMAGVQEAIVLKEKFEIISLSGTLSVNGCHFHISISDSTGTVTGGHLKEGCIVRTTAEVVITIMDELIFSREADSLTGFRELRVTNKDRQ
jgi:predicted DNA-binding protein with PD1-like motif